MSPAERFLWRALAYAVGFGVLVYVTWLVQPGTP